MPTRKLASVFFCLLLACWPLNAAAQAPTREVSITIDDLDVNAEDTPRLSLDERNTAILNSLRRAGIKTVIFVCGMRVTTQQARSTCEPGTTTDTSSPTTPTRICSIRRRRSRNSPRMCSKAKTSSRDIPAFADG